MTKSRLLLSAVAAVLSLPNTAVTAFTSTNNHHASAIAVASPRQTSTSLHQSAASSSSRRSFFAFATASVLSSAVVLPSATNAASSASPPTPEELKRIRTGYENIQYLLANWEKETTVCRENGGECKRDADPVRKYLGLRSTTDPLFQIEKVFNKVKYMDNVDADKLDDFFEATEDWNSSMAMSNSMAFISQFGEYNPGGGKDEVLKYLDESKKQVILAEKALKRIIDTLDSAST